MDMEGKVSPHFLIDGVAGDILNTFQNPLGFHFMVLEEKPFSKGQCTHPKKEKQNFSKEVEWTFGFHITSVMATRWQQRQEYWNGQEQDYIPRQKLYIVRSTELLLKL